jgi:hypothetical protein
MKADNNFSKHFSPWEANICSAGQDILHTL